MIKPFEHIKKPTAAKGIASVKYVERRLREVLGKLHFTGTGVKSSADGQIHIDLNGDGDGATDYPFKITASGAGIILSPGQFKMAGDIAVQVKLNGLPINPPANQTNWTPPVLTVPIGISNIVLECPFTPQFGSQDIYDVPINYINGALVTQHTVSVRAYSSMPNDVASKINYPEASADEGKFYIRIGQVNRANTGSLTVLIQDWHTNISAAPQGDGSLFLAAA